MSPGEPLGGPGGGVCPCTRGPWVSVGRGGAARAAWDGLHLLADGRRVTVFPRRAGHAMRERT